jgi:divalent metal cation (Fe/Co/Zn/Cd) transporter
MKTAPSSRSFWISLAFWLSLITIVYNLLEGLISVYFGYSDGTLVLTGFGLDSFVEVISGAGILHMVVRMKATAVAEHDAFERRALRITGISFLVLAAGLILGSIARIFTRSVPETTFAGILISLASLLSMFALMYWKLRAGRL